MNKRQESRLRAMNDRLYPAKLRLRADTGAFIFDQSLSGRRVRKTLGTDMELAYDRAMILRRQASGVPVVSSRKIDLETWVAEWSKVHYAGLSPHTRRSYESYYTKISRPLGSLKLADLRPETVEPVLAEINGDTMRNRVGAWLSTALKAAKVAGFIDDPGWTMAHRRNRREVPMMSSDELGRLFDVASPGVRCALALAGFCGLRTGEIMALRRADIDLERMIVTVARARVRIYGEHPCDMVKAPKNGRVRVVPIAAAAIDYIMPYVSDVRGGGFIYPTFRSDLSTRLRVACERADLPRVSMHGLRHICGSNLMMSSGPAAAQAVLGHADIGTTVNVYGHLTPIYLRGQMNLPTIMAALPDLADYGDLFSSHPDPCVRELAALLRCLCPDLARRQKKTGT